jgi:inorganic triphosphatase YgiF
MKGPHIEVESKLIARDAAALAGVLQALRGICSRVRDLGHEVIQDSYLDTPDWRLYRAGYACRIRRTSRRPAVRAVLALKSLHRPRRGVSTREEHEQVVSWSRCRSRLSQAAGCEGALGAKILGLIDGQQARVIFRIRNRRQTYSVRFGKHLLAHVSLDDFTLLAGARRRRFAEVEIEIRQGSVEELHQLTRLLRRRAGLSAESRSKFRLGLDLAGLKPEAGKLGD